MVDYCMSHMSVCIYLTTTITPLQNSGGNPVINVLCDTASLNKRATEVLLKIINCEKL